MELSTDLRESSKCNPKALFQQRSVQAYGSWAKAKVLKMGGVANILQVMGIYQSELRLLAKEGHKRRTKWRMRFPKTRSSLLMIDKVCGGKGVLCRPSGRDSGDGRFLGSHCKQCWARMEALLWLQPPEHRDYGSEPPHPCEGPRAHSLKTASSRNQFKLSLSFSFLVRAAFSATQAAGGENVILQAYSQYC